jgi:hypothetical protein
MYTPEQKVTFREINAAIWNQAKNLDTQKLWPLNVDWRDYIKGLTRKAYDKSREKLGEIEVTGSYDTHILSKEQTKIVLLAMLSDEGRARKRRTKIHIELPLLSQAFFSLFGEELSSE